MGSPGEYKQYKPKVVEPTPEPTKEVLAQPELQSWAKGPDVDPIMTALTGGSGIGTGIGAGIKEDVIDPVTGFFGDIWRGLQIPGEVSGALYNFGTLMGGMGPDPSMPLSMQAYVPPKNYDRDPLGKIEAVMDNYNEKDNNFFNSWVNFADSINEVNEIPGGLQAGASITTDPFFWLTPSKLRYVPTGVRALDTAMQGKYLPFIGGFDYMKSVTNAGQGTNAAALGTTRVIDDLLKEAENLDTSMKSAGKETTAEIAGFVPKPKIKRIPVPDSPQVRAIIQKMKEAKPMTKDQKLKYSEERRARIGAFQEEMRAAFDESGEWPDKAMFRELMETHLSGQFERVPGWSPLIESTGPEAFTQTDYDAIVQYIAEFSGGGRGGGYDYIANMQAWFALADGAHPPQPAQLKRLEQMFGTDLIDSISDGVGKVDKAWATTIDLLGIPRTVVSSLDMSAALRQGRAMGAENPKEFQEAFVTMHKIMFSEAGTVAVEESILNHKLYSYAEAGGLFFAERGGKAGNREEAFVSKFAAKWIPGVKISERAYSTFLNKFRHDIYFKTIEEWHASGVSKSLDDYKDLSDIINWGTGRGPGFGGNIRGKFADFLNVMFFAPRFTTAGPSFIVGGAVKAGRNEAVSKIWGANMASFIQSSVMWLRFMDMAGGEVEMNPASSDFGKGKLGPHRFDFFGGYLPLARYAYQTATGKRKSLGTGITYDISRDEPIRRWGESKLSPTGAAGLDTYTGEDFLGETVTFGSFTGAKDEFLERMVPMIVGDFMEAMEQYDNPIEMLHNPTVPLGLAFSIYGGGFQSFTTTKDLKDQITNQIWPTLVYDDLPIDSEQQHRIDNHPIIKDHYEQLAAKRPSETGQDSWRRGIKNWADVNTRILETGLEESTPGFITLVNQQGPGKKQRQYIQEFNDKRWNNWVISISPQADEWNKSRTFDHLVKIMDEGNSQPALLREKYWSINAPMMLIDVEGTGLYLDMQDFDYQKQKRAEVIRDAMTLGVVRTLYDETGFSYPDPTDKNLEIITSRRPIYTEDETDPEKIKFQQSLDEYSEDSKFLGEHFFSLDRQYFKDFYPDNPEIMYKDYLNYLNSRSTALDNAVELKVTRHDYKALTFDINAYRRNERSAGWGKVPGGLQDKEKAKQITRLLIKWGYLRLNDSSIPQPLMIELEKEFLPQQEEAVEQFLRR